MENTGLGQKTGISCREATNFAFKCPKEWFLGGGRPSGMAEMLLAHAALFLIDRWHVVLAEQVVERLGHEVLQRRIIRPLRLHKTNALFEVLV